MMEGWAVWKILLLNLFVCFMWHNVVLFMCVKINTKHLNYTSRWYRIKEWEQNGKFYDKHFKIKKWKDRIPQRVGRKGFSKKNIDTKNLSAEYLDRFLLETCRAEWNHAVGCGYVFVAFFMNSEIIYAIIFSVPVFSFNLACLMIQRYNRARLVTLKKRLDRKKKIQEKKEQGFMSDTIIVNHTDA